METTVADFQGLTSDRPQSHMNGPHQLKAGLLESIIHEV